MPLTTERISATGSDSDVASAKLRRTSVPPIVDPIRTQTAKWITQVMPNRTSPTIEREGVIRKQVIESPVSRVKHCRGDSKRDALEKNHSERRLICELRSGKAG